MTTDHPAAKVQTTARPNNSKLFVSLELSRSAWLVTASAPGSDKFSKYAVAGGDGRALVDLLDRLRRTAERRVEVSVEVVAIQEAGLDGFWIHRLLANNGVESHVVDAASIAVDRRHRRVKTDAIDGETLLRTLMAWARGERRVCSMVRPPSPAEEDRRRLTRERGTLLKERIQHTNRIKGLLSGQGITDYDPLGKNRHTRLDALKTGDGRTLPDRLKMEIRREIDRLDLVNAQIATVERERDALVKTTVDVDAQNAAAVLSRLKGIGAEFSSLIWLAQLCQSAPNRGLCGSGTQPVAERQYRPGPRHLEVGQPSSAPYHDRTRLVLVTSSTRLRAERVVSRPGRPGPRAAASNCHRGTRPQTSCRALALCDPGCRSGGRRIQGIRMPA